MIVQFAIIIHHNKVAKSSLTSQRNWKSTFKNDFT